MTGETKGTGAVSNPAQEMLTGAAIGSNPEGATLPVVGTFAVYDWGMQNLVANDAGKSLPLGKHFVVTLAAAEAERTHWKGRHAILQILLDERDAEIKRLNEWADSATDGHLKERQTSNELLNVVKDLNAKQGEEIASLRAELEQARKDAERWQMFVNAPEGVDFQSPNLYGLDANEINALADRALGEGKE